MDVNTKCLFPLAIPTLMHIDDYMSMDDWLWDNIGQEEIDFEWGWPLTHIFFAREEDKVKFILRWL